MELKNCSTLFCFLYKYEEVPMAADQSKFVNHSLSMTAGVMRNIQDYAVFLCSIDGERGDDDLAANDIIRVAAFSFCVVVDVPQERFLEFEGAPLL